MAERPSGEQERELRRLVEEEGLAEEQARRLANERQFDVPPGAYIDVDSDDSFLDLPEPSYQCGPITSEEIDEVLAAAKRGELKLPKLPPPVER